MTTEEKQAIREIVIMATLFIASVVAIFWMSACSKSKASEDEVSKQIIVLIELAKERENLPLEGIMQGVHGAYLTNRESVLFEYVIKFTIGEMEAIEKLKHSLPQKIEKRTEKAKEIPGTSRQIAIY